MTFQPGVKNSFLFIKAVKQTKLTNCVALNIRPVSLAVELFTVLERGRKANLALAKFTQEKGAKSSFERVAKTMQQVLENKGFIIEDEHRAKAIKSVLVI